MHYTVGDTIYKTFTTRAFATGIPTVLAGTPVVSAYEDNSLTQITAGITLGVDHDSVAGLNLLTLVLTGANGYEAGKDYNFVITTGTVGGVSVVGETVLGISLDSDPAFVRLGAPAGASVSADIAVVEGQTDDIGVAGVGLTALPISPANVTQISGDSTAADNLELMYDTTGYTDETAPASRAQVDSIGTASGAALNYEASADNTSGAIIDGVTIVGSITANLFSDTAIENGTRHQLTHSANAFDFVYRLPIGGGRTAATVEWRGYLTSSNDTLSLQAYDFGGAIWNTIATITGTNQTSNGTVIAALLSKHTGTGSELGNVYIRFVTSGQTSPVLNTDLLLVQAVNIGQSIGYDGARVWIDTTDGVSGTESYVNGVADNKSASIADALTIAGNLNLKIFEATRDSVIAPAGDFNNFTIYGTGYTFTLGGHDYAGTHIYHASPLTGTATSTGNSDHFDVLDSIVGAVTVDDAHFTRCAHVADITLSGVGSATPGQLRLVDCFSLVADDGDVAIDFGTGSENHNVNIIDWQGNLQLTNFNVVTTGGTDTINITGKGKLLIDATCDSGTIYLRGHWDIQDNSAGAVTITQDDPATEITAIKAKTDDLTFTKANEIDANIQSVIGDTVQVSSSKTTNWGGSP